MQPSRWTHRPQVMGAHWTITADHPLAASAGAAILERGGDAVDAAVAANLVLTVTRPHMCGPGGDLFGLFFRADTGQTWALNASGRAPSGATLDALAAAGLTAMPEFGVRAATVPGAVAGWQAALDRWGRMGLDAHLARAVDYAENGFPMYPELAEELGAAPDLLDRNPDAAQAFAPRQTILPPGARVVQSHLARTYRTLADQGPGALYGGELGRRLVEHSDRNQGWFTLDDLAAHRVDWTAPIETRYRGRRVLTHPPNSQGIALLMQADLLDQFEPEWFDPDEEEWIHLMVEAKKLAFADRDRWVCDPDFMPVSTERLLDRGAAKGRAALITPERAAESPTPRRFADGGRDTVYLAVVDAAGNAVSLIQSIYMPFGSRSVVPDTGIILHNRALGFSVDPDHPNHLAPKKRPYHTLHPAMILDGDRPTHVLGSPGADGQTQTVMQLIGRLIDFGYQPQAAVEAPRWRSQPDGSLWLESRFSPPVVSALAAKGHDARLAGPYDPLMGSAQVIAIDPDQGVLAAGACPRRQAYAAGR